MLNLIIPANLRRTHANCAETTFARQLSRLLVRRRFLNRYTTKHLRMECRIVGAILLSAAGLVIAVGIVGAQIANGIVRAGFYAASGGIVPTGPEDAYPYWFVVVSALVLAATGGVFLVGRDQPRRPHESET